MNTKFTQATKGVLLVLAALLLQASTNAATFTAILSGNFSSTATWAGGLIPPSLISADDIVIPVGINITLDQDQSISGTGSLQVDGTLVGDPGNYLSLTTGTLSGAGSITVDSLHTAFTSGFNFTGTLTADYWANANATISTAANIMVNKTLNLTAGALDMAAGSLVIGSNANIIVSGGTMTTSGGSLALTNNYHVTYTAAATTGLELSGSGLKDVTVSVPASSSVSLGSDLDVNGNLNLVSGTLNLNSRNLVFKATGNLQGTGNINSSSNSDITINASAGLTNMITFASGGNSVDDLTINLGSSSSKVNINGTLMVHGQLSLQNGRIDIGPSDLHLMTNATVTGGSANSYVVTGTGGTMSIDVAANGAQTFHIGTANNYAPIVISGNNTSATSKFSAGVNASVKQNGTAGINLNDTQPLVNATWHIASSTTANVNVDIETRWSTAMEVNSFNRAKAYLSHYTNAGWDVTASSAATSTGGMYAIKRTGVTSFSPFAVFDENTSTSVDNVPAQRSISVYPNPASAEITVSLDGGNNAVAEIYTTTGRLVNTATLNGNTNNINIASLPAGMYYIRIGNDSGYGVAKFIKQ